jgi:hypothetical protein
VKAARCSRAAAAFRDFRASHVTLSKRSPSAHLAGAFRDVHAPMVLRDRNLREQIPVLRRGANLYSQISLCALLAIQLLRERAARRVRSTSARWTSRSDASLLCPLSAPSSSARRITASPSSSGENPSAWADSFSA